MHHVIHQVITDENLTKTLNLTLYSDSSNNYVDVDVNQGLNIWHLKQQKLVYFPLQPKKHIFKLRIFFSITLY